MEDVQGSGNISVLDAAVDWNQGDGIDHGRKRTKGRITTTRRRRAGGLKGKWYLKVQWTRMDVCG